MVRTTVVRAVTPSEEEQLFGLDFAGSAANGGFAPSPMLVWHDSVSVAPPAMAPLCIGFEAFLRIQPENDGDRFWTGVFYAPYDTDASLEWLTTDKYAGLHPYIDQKWEIATDQLDLPSDRGTAPAVTYDVWVKCVLRIVGDVITGWYDLDADLSMAHTMTNDDPTSDPCIVMGDAPWHRMYEVWSGIIRNIFIIEADLSRAQLLSTFADHSAIVTPWYSKRNPKPDDIADESGNGNHPVWVPFIEQEPPMSDLPSLWEGP